MTATIGRLELAADARGLARLVDKPDFASLVAALVRVDLHGEHDNVRQRASPRRRRPPRPAFHLPRA